MLLTGGSACTSIWLQLVAIFAIATEGATFIEAGLTAESRDETLVYVVAGLWVIQQLESWVTGTLSPKWTLNTAMTAASIIHLTVVFVYKNKKCQNIRLWTWILVSKFILLKQQQKYSLQRGDSSAPLGQSLWPSHTWAFMMHTWSVGHNHWPDGQLNGGVGQFVSSLISLQSFSPSHTQFWDTQFPLAHWNCTELQVRGGQPLCSSEPSTQSGWPSHSHSFGMQNPSTWHWNSLSWHRPGPRVAAHKIPVINYSQPNFINNNWIKWNIYFLLYNLIMFIITNWHKIYSSIIQGVKLYFDWKFELLFTNKKQTYKAWFTSKNIISSL